MAQDWASILFAKKTAWGVPQAALDDISDKAEHLKTLLETPQAARTPALNAQIRTAEKDLTKAMRDVKKRYFHAPPLADADFVSLGLRPKDTTPTNVGRPTGVPALSVTYDKTGRINVHIKVVEGATTDARTNYGFQIYYGAFAAGSEMPASGEDLRQRRFSRQKSLNFSFQPADKGKTAFFAARCENSKGDAGDWGAMVQAVIP
jgi:hypothetical protein